MKISEFSKDLEHRAGIGRYAQIMNVVLVIVVAAQALALASADRTHRETLVPPEITKTFWVEDKRVSSEYLEQMGVYLLHLAMNRSPANADIQIEALLKYVAPASYPELRRQLLADVTRQKEDKVTTAFYPRLVTVDEDRQAVLFEGELKTWIGEKHIKTDMNKYLIKFGYKGRIYIEEFKDVTTEKDPWNA